MKLPFTEKLNISIYRAYRHTLWRSPALHKLYLNLRGFPIDFENKDLVVQGFGRSGNTFVTEAIKVCSNKRIDIFSHLHVPVVIHEAINSNTPICFLIRAPEDAVTSLALHSNWSATRCLDHYVEYHRIIKEVSDLVCIFEFSKFTRDINCLLQGLSTHLGMNFPAVSHKNVETIVFDRIEKHQLEKYGEIDETTIHRPSLIRAQAKNKLLSEIAMQEHLLLKARSLFEFFKSKAI